MHSKWLDVGLEIGAFHLQSRKFDDIRPPSFGDNPNITSVIRSRERLSMRMSAEKIRELSVTPLKDRRQSHLWSKPLRSLVKKRRKKRKDLNYVVQNPLNSTTKHCHNLIPLPSKLTHGNPSSAKLRPSSLISSSPLMDGGIEEEDPSLLLQEAAHLISLLSAVSFSTLRGDIEGADIPLKFYIPGSPWPATNSDADSDVRRKANSFYRSSKVTRVFRFLFGISRNQAQQTIYNACREFGVLGGISDAECDLLKSARGPLAKTALCSFWLQEFISREFEHGAFGNISPPVVSRLYQFTSDGMLGYNQARKVAYVPFPFPHTQLTSLYVLLMLGFLPVLMLSYVENVIVAAIFNLMSVTVLVGLHEVSKELEEPFMNAPNDLPLNNFQAQFNEALIAMYAGYHPESWWSVAEDVNSEEIQI